MEVGALMYEKPPDKEKLVALKNAGIDPEDLACNGSINVWPENRQAVYVFMTLRTQWRYGMNGPTGLDYSALPETWRRTKTPPADRDQVFAALRILEVAALNEMHKAD